MNKERLVYQKDIVEREIIKECNHKVSIINMRPGELLYHLEKFPVAYLPIGTVEWHGHQNPLGCDGIKAQRLCEAVASEIGGVVMPCFFFGVDRLIELENGIGQGMDGHAGMVLPGSFYQIDEELFIKLISKACRNYFERGFELVVLVSGHNPRLQGECMRKISEEFALLNKRVIYSMEFELVDDKELVMGDHAGGYETSMMLYLNEELVDLSTSEKALNPYLGIGTKYPLETSSKEIGRQQFKSQVLGMSKWVLGEYKK